MRGFLAMRAIAARAMPGASAADPSAPADPPRAIPSAASTTHSHPWRAVTVQAAGVWLATRAALAAFTYFTMLLSASGPRSARTPFPPNVLLQNWERWDAGWYTAVATRLYADPLQTAFFPLYPLLVHAVALVTGSANAFDAAMLVSNICALLAFIAVGLLAANEGGPHAPRPALLALAAYPLAFFLAAAYAEPLFLALAAFSLLCARRGMWLGAAGCAFLAALTRPMGAALIAPLLWEYGRQCQWRLGGWRDRRALRTLAGGTTLLAAVPLAIGLYAAFLWMRFGDPLSFVHVQSTEWHRDAVPVWRSFVLAVQSLATAPAWTYQQARVLADLGPLAIMGALTLLTVRRMPAAFTLYMLGVLYFALATPMPAHWDPFAAAGRYLLPSIPIFLLVGRWMEGRPWLEALVVGGGFLLQGALLAQFLQGRWLI